MTPFIQHIQNVADAPGRWPDEFLAWYKPDLWETENRAAAVFIGEKFAALLADMKGRHQRQHDAEALAGEYLMQRDDARAELERLRAQVAPAGMMMAPRDVLQRCRDTAMLWTIQGRIPECGQFGGIAQDLDAILDVSPAAPAQQAGQAPAPEPGRAKLVAELMMMVGRYWDIAYVEGKEGRLHDTPAGDAQRALSAIYEAAKHLAGVTPCAAVKPEPIGYLSEHTGPDGPFKWQFSKTLAGVYLDTALRIIPVYEPPVQAQGAHP